MCVCGVFVCEYRSFVLKRWQAEHVGENTINRKLSSFQHIWKGRLTIREKCIPMSARERPAAAASRVTLQIRRRPYFQQLPHTWRSCSEICQHMRVSQVFPKKKYCTTAPNLCQPSFRMKIPCAFKNTLGWIKLI